MSSLVLRVAGAAMIFFTTACSDCGEHNPVAPEQPGNNGNGGQQPQQTLPKDSVIHLPTTTPPWNPSSSGNLPLPSGTSIGRVSVSGERDMFAYLVGDSVFFYNTGNGQLKSVWLPGSTKAFGPALSGDGTIAIAPGLDAGSYQKFNVSTGEKICVGKIPNATLTFGALANGQELVGTSTGGLYLMQNCIQMAVLSTGDASPGAVTGMHIVGTNVAYVSGNHVPIRTISSGTLMGDVGNVTSFSGTKPIKQAMFFPSGKYVAVSRANTGVISIFAIDGRKAGANFGSLVLNLDPGGTPVWMTTCGGDNTFVITIERGAGRIVQVWNPLHMVTQPNGRVDAMGVLTTEFPAQGAVTWQGCDAAGSKLTTVSENGFIQRYTAKPNPAE